MAHFIADKNNTVLKLKINSFKQKVYINYYSNKDLLSIDLKDKIVFNRWNFLALKVLAYLQFLKCVFFNISLNLRYTKINSIYLSMNQRFIQICQLLRPFT